jgi:hypothetical protein
MKKQYNVMHTLQVTVSHDFEAHDSDTYMAGIGAVEMIDTNEPLYIKLPNGKTIMLRINDLDVLDTSVEEVEE